MVLKVNWIGFPVLYEVVDGDLLGERRQTVAPRRPHAAVPAHRREAVLALRGEIIHLRRPERVQPERVWPEQLQSRLVGGAFRYQQLKFVGYVEKPHVGVYRLDGVLHHVVEPLRPGGGVVRRAPAEPAGQIRFGGVKDMGSEKKFQGKPRDLLVIDEATNSDTVFTTTILEKLFFSVRRKQSQPP